MGGWIWIFPALTFVLFWGGVYLLGRSELSNNRSGETAMEILKKRYARGEISKGEVEEMKRDM
jgi:putative membrane protein